MKLILENLNWRDKFDITKTGHGSDYDAFLNPEGLAYKQKAKNLTGEIVEMTPQEYIDKCVSLFRAGQNPYSSSNNIRRGRLNDKETMNEIKSYEKIYLPFIDLARNGQEGLHRAIAAEELGYEKIPVLVIDWFNKERHELDLKVKKYYKDAEDIIDTYLPWFSRTTKSWNSLEEVKKDLIYDLDDNNAEYGEIIIDKESSTYISGLLDIIHITIKGIQFEIIIKYDKDKKAYYREGNSIEALDYYKVNNIQRKNPYNYLESLKDQNIESFLISDKLKHKLKHKGYFGDVKTCLQCSKYIEQLTHNKTQAVRVNCMFDVRDSKGNVDYTEFYNSHMVIMYQNKIYDYTAGQLWNEFNIDKNLLSDDKLPLIAIESELDPGVYETKCGIKYYMKDNLNNKLILKEDFEVDGFDIVEEPLKYKYDIEKGELVKLSIPQKQYKIYDGDELIGIVYNKHSIKSKINKYLKYGPDTDDLNEKLILEENTDLQILPYLSQYNEYEIVYKGEQIGGVNFKPNPLNTSQIHIVKLFINEEHRNKGYGTQVIKKIIKDYGKPIIVQPDSDESERFYAKLGTPNPINDELRKNYKKGTKIRPSYTITESIERVIIYPADQAKQILTKLYEAARKVLRNNLDSDLDGNEPDLNITNDRQYAGRITQKGDNFECIDLSKINYNYNGKTLTYQIVEDILETIAHEFAHIQNMDHSINHKNLTKKYFDILKRDVKVTIQGQGLQEKLILEEAESIEDIFNMIKQLVQKGKINKDKADYFWSIIRQGDNSFLISEIMKKIKYLLNSIISDEQESFFKNSKIRDKEGNLITCIHSTPYEFEEFIYDKIGTNINIKNGPGFYFATFNYAERYPRTLKCYLNITNPLYIQKFEKDKFEIIDKLTKKAAPLIGTTNSGMKQLIFDFNKETGYDGVIVGDLDDYDVEIMAFFPNQIKYITNTTPTNSNKMNEKLLLKESKNITVYHASKTPLTTFDLNKSDANKEFGLHVFDSHDDMIKAFPSRMHYKLEVELKKSFHITKDWELTDNWNSQMVIKTYIDLTGDDSIRSFVKNIMQEKRISEANAVRAWFIKKGYDSISYVNTVEGSENTLSYVLIDKSTIKNWPPELIDKSKQESDLDLDSIWAEGVHLMNGIVHPSQNKNIKQLRDIMDKASAIKKEKELSSSEIQEIINELTYICDKIWQEYDPSWDNSVLPCEFCGKDTWNNEDKFILKDEIWSQVSKDEYSRFICWDCVEKRLDRKLVKKDFKDLPLTKANERYQKLTEKLMLEEYIPTVFEDNKAKALKDPNFIREEDYKGYKILLYKPTEILSNEEFPNTWKGHPNESKFKKAWEDNNKKQGKLYKASAYQLFSKGSIHKCTIEDLTEDLTLSKLKKLLDKIIFEDNAPIPEYKSPSQEWLQNELYKLSEKSNIVKNGGWLFPNGEYRRLIDGWHGDNLYAIQLKWLRTIEDYKRVHMKKIQKDCWFEGLIRVTVDFGQRNNCDTVIQLYSEPNALQYATIEKLTEETFARGKRVEVSMTTKSDIEYNEELIAILSADSQGKQVVNAIRRYFKTGYKTELLEDINNRTEGYINQVINVSTPEQAVSCIKSSTNIIFKGIAWAHIELITPSGLITLGVINYKGPGGRPGENGLTSKDFPISPQDTIYINFSYKRGKSTYYTTITERSFRRHNANNKENYFMEEAKEIIAIHKNKLFKKV